MRILRGHLAHPLRHRLWQMGLALLMVISFIVVGETISRNTDGSHRLSLGEDFLPVYAAGKLVRQGRGGRLYDVQSLARIERQTVAQADLDPLPVYGPFLNPPFFAAAYAPLAALPYRQALRVWLAINLLLLCGSIVLMCRWIGPDAGWRARSMVALAVVLPLPFWEAMCHQQNTMVSLFLLCATVTLWRSTAGAREGPWRAVACGMFAGLLVYKPQLALAIAVVLILTRGWPALAGLAISGLILLGFTLAYLPGTIPAYLHALPPTIHWMRTQRHYNWGRQVTPQSFWRLLIQGDAIGATRALPMALTILTAVAASTGLIAAVVTHLRRRDTDARSLDRLIAATIVSMPLIMPYYMDYDLLLLAAAAILLALDWPRANPSRADRFLRIAWIALLMEMYVNPGLASHTGLNLAVPLIGAVAALSIARCLRPPFAAKTSQEYDLLNIPLAA